MGQVEGEITFFAYIFLAVNLKAIYTDTKIEEFVIIFEMSTQ